MSEQREQGKETERATSIMLQSMNPEAFSETPQPSESVVASYRSLGSGPYLEIRRKLKALGAKISLENSAQGELMDLVDCINACGSFYQEVNEKELENILNMIISLILNIQENEWRPFIMLLCSKIRKLPSIKMGNVALKVLEYLFSEIGEHSQLSFDVYQNFLFVSRMTENTSLIFNSIEEIKRWLFFLEIDTEKTKIILQELYNLLLKTKQNDLAAKVKIELNNYQDDYAGEQNDCKITIQKFAQFSVDTDVHELFFKYANYKNDDPAKRKTTITENLALTWFKHAQVINNTVTDLSQTSFENKWREVVGGREASITSFKKFVRALEVAHDFEPLNLFGQLACAEIIQKHKHQNY